MKGVIVAAGYGTRFLPVTKTIPKEMLPLINRPSIDFIVEEFIGAGIRDIIIISSRRKMSLENFFDREIELEEVFKRENAQDKMDKIALPKNVHFSFVRQAEMRGTGHALLQVKDFIGDEPVVVAYPDDLHFGKVPLSKQLVDLYEKTKCCVMATIHNPPNLERYGVLALEDDNFHVTDIVEKPPTGAEPSKEVSIGRYLYTPQFFDYLEEGWEIHQRGKDADKEYFHVYALKKMMKDHKVVYKEVEGERLDTGGPEGYLRAIIKYASMQPELLKVLKEEVDAL